MMKFSIAGLVAVAALTAVQAEVKLDAAFPAGVQPDAAVAQALAPELKDANLVYAADLKNAARNENGKIVIKYTTDNSAAVKPFKTVGYILYLVGNDGKVEYVCTTMDAFSDSAAKIGVPTFASEAQFQQKVKNLTVKSNVDGVKNGAFPEGNIEFWPTDYGAEATLKLPNAKGGFDLDDTKHNGGGYGSMQVHNFGEGQTVFAYNAWRNGPNADIGIGNQTSGNPDWTFSNNLKNQKNAILIVFTR